MARKIAERESDKKVKQQSNIKWKKKKKSSNETAIVGK